MKAERAETQSKTEMLSRFSPLPAASSAGVPNKNSHLARAIF